MMTSFRYLNRLRGVNPARCSQHRHVNIRMAQEVIQPGITLRACDLDRLLESSGINVTNSNEFSALVMNFQRFKVIPGYASASDNRETYLPVMDDRGCLRHSVPVVMWIDCRAGSRRNANRIKQNLCVSHKEFPENYHLGTLKGRDAGRFLVIERKIDESRYASYVL
jgi:hypothetical protein